MSGDAIRIPVYRAESANSGAKDLSTFREREVYVIIGRGFAAVANHLTLRASTNPEVRARVDRCRMVIVGGGEPWKARGATPLGQFPHMLALPSYQPLSGGRSYALANEFGQYISDAEKSLTRHGDQNVRFPDRDFRLPDNAWIGLIETFDQYKKSKVPDDEQRRRDDATRVGPKPEEWDQHPGFPYRLSVFWREPKAEKRSVYYLYAHYVDVCTGPGPVRLLKPAVWASSDLQVELDGKPDDQPDYLVGKPGEFKRLIKGEHHIGANLPAKPGRQKVLLYGASPSAAWSAEHVLKNGHVGELFWVADPDPKIAPPEIKGQSYGDALRTYFYHPNRANAPGGRNLETLNATQSRQFLGTITRIEEGQEGRLKITYSVPSDAPGEWKNPVFHEFDQVVISIGQDNSVTRPGSASYLVQVLGGMNPIYAEDLWNDLQGTDKKIPLGTTDRRGGVRVLGSAGARGPGLDGPTGQEFMDNYKAHSDKIPAEGRAGGNAILVAAATVELANRLLPARLDANRACESLIQRIVGSAEISRRIVDARKNDAIRKSSDGASSYLGKGFLTIDEVVSVTEKADSDQKFLAP